MELDNIVLYFLEAAQKMYSVILRKPYVTVKVQYAPQRDRDGKVTKDLFAFTIINASSPEVELKKGWFLTSYNRPVYSEAVDSKFPVKVAGRDRITYFLPIEEIKNELNKNAADTIAEAVVSDETGRRYSSRVDKATQEEFAK